MPAAHPITVRSFLTYLYCTLVWSNGIPGSSCSRGSDQMGCRANAFGCEALPWDWRKQKNTLCKSGCWCYEPFIGTSGQNITSISKLGPFCTQWMCSSFWWNVWIALEQKICLGLYWIPILGHFYQLKAKCQCWCFLYTILFIYLLLYLDIKYFKIFHFNFWFNI